MPVVGVSATSFSECGSATALTTCESELSIVGTFERHFWRWISELGSLVCFGVYLATCNYTDARSAERSRAAHVEPE